ncbi:MAG: zf-HC2 domain-containing protein [Nitrospinae bacterium]|nr:zf-HC2 domain-containing protein [Nitrospinota bacterium]
MMVCAEFSEQVWDYLAGVLPPGAAQEMKAHADTCPQCVRELDAAHGVRNVLLAPPAQDIEKARERVFARVYAQKAEVVPIRRKNWLRFVAPAIGAAAAAFVIAVAMWPEPTSALSLDDLVNEHAHCVVNEQYKNYPYATNDEFSRRAVSEMGRANRPMPASQCKFLRGGFCDLKGVRTAHAVLSSDGGLVSRFSLRENCRTFLENGGLEAIREGLWRARVGEATVVLVEQREGNCDVFLGDASFEILVKIVDNG